MVTPCSTSPGPPGHRPLRPVTGCSSAGHGSTRARAPPCENHRNALDLRLAGLAGLAELPLSHMEHEEHEFLPLVHRVIANDDFVATEKALTETYPTTEIPFLVPWRSTAALVWERQGSAGAAHFHVV